MTPARIYSTTKEVARLLIEETLTAGEAADEIGLTSVQYHIRKLLSGGYIAKCDPDAYACYYYVPGPNYDALGHAEGPKGAIRPGQADFAADPSLESGETLSRPGKGSMRILYSGKAISLIGYEQWHSLVKSGDFGRPGQLYLLECEDGRHLAVDCTGMMPRSRFFEDLFAACEYLVPGGG